jgi:hypothetical protein
MRTEFFTVASPGRSGTKWYSEVFRTDDSYCFHELTTACRRYPVNIAMIDRLAADVAGYPADDAARRLVLEGFPDYYTRLWERAASGVRSVGNSDHLATPLLTGLYLLWPRMRFLFSFRNGIQQVDSMFRWEEHAELALLASWRKRYGEHGYFELCCCDWAGVVADLERHRDVLRARGAGVRETRFERVLENKREFKRVWKWLFGRWDDAGKQARALTGTVVNARHASDSVRTVEEVWTSWSDEQRDRFATICGETQRRLGYSLPATASGAS